MTKRIWLVQGLENKDWVIAGFGTQELAEEYRKLFGLEFCTKIVPLPYYPDKEALIRA